MEYNLGDKVILDGLKGYWEIVGIESFSETKKRFVLRLEVENNHKYKEVDCLEMFCCEKTLKRLTARI